MIKREEAFLLIKKWKEEKSLIRTVLFIGDENKSIGRSVVAGRIAKFSDDGIFVLGGTDAGVKIDLGGAIFDYDDERELEDMAGQYSDFIRSMIVPGVHLFLAVVKK